jgi:hypothetical protein
MFREASGRRHGSDYRQVGRHFVSILTTLVPDDFDEEVQSWSVLLDIELVPILRALDAESSDFNHVGQLRAWTRCRFPRVAELVPSQRWKQFALGATEAMEELC